MQTKLRDANVKRYSEVAGDGGSGILEQVAGWMAALNKRVEKIRHIIVIVSAKGGVGKSFVTAMLAKELAGRGHLTGALDADINGSSLPYLLDAESHRASIGENGALPARGSFGVKVMSLDYFIGLDGAPVSWQGPSATYPWLGSMEATAIRELLAGSDWGELDYLLIDTPPSLARLTDLTGMLPSISGVVVVTTPSKVSYRVVLKSMERIYDTGAPVIGLVENMGGMVCRECGARSPVFNGEDMGGALDYIKLPLLGTVPFVSEEGIGAAKAAISGICGEIIQRAGAAA
ncbi:MAG: P-loop NTPase [Nitrospinae bacterium]|nr:P-loop NTPase [Nitrospinota bacterium]